MIRIWKENRNIGCLLGVFLILTLGFPFTVKARQLMNKLWHHYEGNMRARSHYACLVPYHIQDVASRPPYVNFRNENASALFGTGTWTANTDACHNLWLSILIANCALPLTKITSSVYQKYFIPQSISITLTIYSIHIYISPSLYFFKRYQILKSELSEISTISPPKGWHQNASSPSSRR